MNISVIIPNYNGQKILEKNIPKVIDVLNEYKNGSIELIIPDDNSSDNSVELLNKFRDENKIRNFKIIIVESTENKGFSSNVNRGVKKAHGEILILLNTDVIPSKNFLEVLLKHFKDELVFAVGCLDESIENEKIVLRGRGIGKWKRGLLVHRAGSLDKENTLWVSGGSGAFRRSIWDKLGGLSELYDPFYWEDIDLSYRALKSGYSILFERNSVVRHEHETGAIKTKYKVDIIRKTAFRNQLIFVWKNADRRYLALNLIWLPYHLIRALISKDLYFIKGFWDAVFRLPKIYDSRKNSMKLFIKSDNEVIANLN